MEDIKKRVDDSWKNQVDKEKKTAQENKETYHEPTFTVFLSSLGMQAMIAMGKIANPVSGKIEKNLEHARFLIDTIAVLKEKTQGNLSQEEDKFVSESLYNLRMNYVEEKEKNNG